mmetsp:Transcript_1661/g.5230  ORF Transcript_1661/g.5230 Transcript_1661/m.5230 type:complete len:243 (-) Transcript_1661:194-922(-)|eukprot:CAMPEP_0203815096 /NCGR_PEP_ID=MMETSP0115-20131106/7516_1 /ASSEMBLY_ACC=CAM_ASM_000227 /TAXON_ID=33651 /ORGANISM="Bicosoecid sp, Strain ms1" /LENGTH=242 /DNA_ID=CAMNT_0050723989 /DNA_START=12 /DNA_END=740 /DNA_ORIENTATION=+
MARVILAIALAALAVGVNARLGDPSPPTLPQVFKASCNTTIDVPMMGPMNLEGPCWWDFTTKKTRQDGNMNTPFGSMPVREIKWYAQSYSECVALQGASGCAYFDPSHTHSVDYTIATQMGMSQCQFTFKEAEDDPFPPLVIPPGSSYSSAVFDGAASDMWQWTWTPPVGPAGMMSIQLTALVSHADPTVLQRLEVTINEMGMQIKQRVDFRDVTPGAIADSIFTDGVNSGCKEQSNHDDHF